MLEEKTPDQQWLFWEWDLRGLDVVSLWNFFAYSTYSDVGKYFRNQTKYH